MSTIRRLAVVVLAGFAIALPAAPARAQGPASAPGPFDSPLAGEPRRDRVVGRSVRRDG